MKSQAVKMEEKQEKIKLAKALLFDKIAYAESNLESNTKKLMENLEDHTEFITFAELMKVYELYKWKSLKSTYTDIKKKTNSDKKVYNQIVRIYSNITNYLTEQEASTVANTLRKLQGASEEMMYSYVLLQKKHRDVLNKCKYLIRNDEITKIYEINPQVQPLITKLYENYIDMKIINKKSRILSNAKSNILGDIQRISQSMGQLK
jgi:hypothetical protein